MERLVAGCPFCICFSNGEIQNRPLNKAAAVEILRFIAAKLATIVP